MAIRTPLCDLLGIEHPIICAPFGPWSQVELAAAVSEAGALGGLGTAVVPVEGLREQWKRVRALTDKPFAINHTRRPFDPAAFDATLEERPAAISFHIGDPGDLPERAHDAGVLWIHQVGNVDQAKGALDGGADVLIAQGGESGGNAGDVAMSVIVPAVVDIAGDVPVIAAGGIADGRGLAAALALGAQGVNVGTRFLASTEMQIPQDWKDAILRAGAEDTVKMTFANYVMPPFTEGAYTNMTPRVLRNQFIESWNDRPEEAAAIADELRADLMKAIPTGKLHELIPLTGQSAALIDDILPAAEIVRRMVAEAEALLGRAHGYVLS
jgi:nitronate monooxygenase/enoyl-[acyl-carrier protein] reductase II